MQHRGQIDPAIVWKIASLYAVENRCQPNDGVVMQIHSARSVLKRSLLASLTVALCAGAEAREWRSYAQYHQPGNRRFQTPTTNQIAKPKPAAPEEKPQKFKDLTINTEFYYLADKDHKTFPWVKISATSAKSVATVAKPTPVVASIPSETLVVVKSGEPKKDTSGKSSDKKQAKAGREVCLTDALAGRAAVSWKFQNQANHQPGWTRAPRKLVAEAALP